MIDYDPSNNKQLGLCVVGDTAPCTPSNSALISNYTTVAICGPNTTIPPDVYGVTGLRHVAEDVLLGASKADSQIKQDNTKVNKFIDIGVGTLNVCYYNNLYSITLSIIFSNTSG